MSQIGSLSSIAPTPGKPSDDATRLKKASHDLEGVFVNEMFKAMRQTVPEDGMMDGGAGEQMFNGMMDEKLSADVASSWERGLGAAVYRQLSTLVRPDAASEGGQ
jgi:flagellar protein FlgJ